MVTMTADPRPASKVEAVLRAATAPLTVAEVAAALGVHATTARFHLERLEARGAVVSEAAGPAGRGRPARRYRLLDVVDARTRMIEALAEAMDGPGTSRARAEAAGERWGSDLPLPTGLPMTAVTTTFAELGFAPAPSDDGLRLRACPFLDAARRNPEVVCGVHLGVARAVTQLAGGTGDVTLEPFTPGGCRLSIQ